MADESDRSSGNAEAGETHSADGSASGRILDPEVVRFDRSAATLGVIFAAAALLTALLTALTLAQDEDFGTPTARSLAGLLIGGLLTFLFGIGALVGLFRALSLTQAGQPLGLPVGSVQALIALLLILLFFIIAVFLYLNVSANNQSERWLSGLTESEIQSLPADTGVVFRDEILEFNEETEQLVSLNPPQFDVLVSRANNPSQIAEDIARQLITTIGTLIVAISAFYFGAKSTSEAPAQADRLGDGNG